MSDLIVFELAEGYEDFSGGNVSLVDGESYDVGEALEDSDGRIVLAPEPRRDDEGRHSEEEGQRAHRDGVIADALKNYPGLAAVEASSSDEPASYAGVNVAVNSGMTKDQLKDRADELGLEGVSKLNKDDLAEAVAKKEAELASASEPGETEEGSATGGDSSTEGSDD